MKDIIENYGNVTRYIFKLYTHPQESPSSAMKTPYNFLLCPFSFFILYRCAFGLTVHVHTQVNSFLQVWGMKESFVWKERLSHCSKSTAFIRALYTNHTIEKKTQQDKRHTGTGKERDTCSATFNIRIWRARKPRPEVKSVWEDVWPHNLVLQLLISLVVSCHWGD